MHVEGHHCGRCGRAPADPGKGPRPFGLPGDREHFGRPRPFDILHLAAALTLVPDERRLHGEVTLTVRRRAPDATHLALDAVGFTVASVRRVDTKKHTALPFSYDGETLSITLGTLDEAAVAIAYEARPQRGMYFFQPDALRPHRPAQVWTQCQDEDARHWLPCHDAPAMRMATELKVTVPAAWTVVSNGRLQGDPQPHGTTERTWHFVQSEPHPSYLLTLAAGTFAEIDESTGALPMRYYVDPGREDDARRSLGRTPAMLAHFEKLLRTPYPWVKYDQVVVHDYSFGGMENTGATTLTDRCLLDARAALDTTSDDLIAHELAHQWFGDLVTCRDWSHGWLNEGFATFCETVEWERQFGDDEARFQRKEYAEQYFAEDDAHYRRPIVCNVWNAPIDLFDRHLYEKGGWVLHMLRAELGEDTFWRGVASYLARHRGTAVETRDLQRAMEDISGRDLGRFFDQWIFKAGHPELEVDARYDADQGAVLVTIKQTQRVDDVTGLFSFPLTLAVVRKGAETRHTVAVRDAVHHLVLPSEGAPDHLAIDPEGTVLMRLSVKTPPKWQVSAATRDPRALVRWRAARSLGKRTDPEARDALERCGRDTFWGVAVEAARALGEMRTPSAEALLVTWMKEATHPKHRRATARALGEFRTERATGALIEALRRGEPSVLVEAELARSIGRTRSPSVYDLLLAVMTRPSWRELVRAGALDGLGALRDVRAIPLLRAQAALGMPDAPRRAAVGALGELGEGQREVREFLEGLLDEDDPMHTPEVLRALDRIHDAESVAAVGRCLRRTSDARVKRVARETLRSLEHRTDDTELRRLRDEFERLRDETRSLRETVARLEKSPPEPPSSVTKKPKTKALSTKKKVPSRTVKGRARKG